MKRFFSFVFAFCAGWSAAVFLAHAAKGELYDAVGWANLAFVPINIVFWALHSHRPVRICDCPAKKRCVIFSRIIPR